MFRAIIEALSVCWKSQMSRLDEDWNETQDREFQDWLYCHGLDIVIFK